MRAVRYPVLDALRGVALIAMASAHLTYETTGVSLLEQLTHAAVWIDGAFFFVALSGVVTGLVHRRVVTRWGVRASQRKLLRRAGFIYLVHVGLVALTVTVASRDPDLDLHATPTWSELGGVLPGLGRVLTLSIEPNYLGVLPMYVVFLLLAIPAVALLHRGAWWAVLGGSAAIYVASAPFDGVPFVRESFGNGGWQLLFLAALLVGWRWEREAAHLDDLRRRQIVIVAAIMASTFLVLARVAPDDVEGALGWTITKFNGGFVAFGFAASALVVLYAALEGARRRWEVVARLLRPLAILGTKGLPGYVAMVLLVLVFDLHPDLPRADLSIVLIVVACGLAELAAVHLDRRRRRLPPAASAA